MWVRGLQGSREISCLAASAVLKRSESGRRGVEADDARAGEVRPFHSSTEGGEQTWATGGGAGGAKGEDRGEHGRATHVRTLRLLRAASSVSGVGRPCRDRGQ